MRQKLFGVVDVKIRLGRRRASFEMISDNDDRGKVVRFPTPVGKLTAEECRRKARELMVQADTAMSVTDKARLLREAATWLERAKSLDG